MSSNLAWGGVTGRTPRWFAWVTAALVGTIALCAGGGLAYLFHVQRKLLHAAATQEVIGRGAILASHVSEAASGVGPAATNLEWRKLDELFTALRHVENGLEYVSVVENGVTLFHRHAGGLGATDRDEGHRDAAPTTNVTAGLSVLDVSGSKVPVVLVSAGAGGRKVEVAIRRDAVNREEGPVGGLISAMFKLSLVTVLVAFVICAVLVAWVVRREALHERRRRTQEHLAFSGVLANGIVHDFRNPMSALRLDVQMLGRESGKGAGADLGKVAGLAERVRGTVDRMDKVFQEFLYMAKPQDSAVEGRADIVACVRETLEMLKPRFEQAGLRTSVDAPNGEIPVLGVESALRRALANVLVNAEQHSPPNGGVEVRVRREAEGAIVEVRDHGPGIPASDRERVFGMFYTTRPGGTGLGLFLARAAIEKCGGSIEAVDCDGGALMRIRLKEARQP